MFAMHPPLYMFFFFCFFFVLKIDPESKYTIHPEPRSRFTFNPAVCSSGFVYMAGSGLGSDKV